MDYLRYLNSIEPEVQFSEDKDYEQKPFLGIVILIDDYDHLYGYVTSGNTEYITRTDNARERIKRLDIALIREYVREMGKSNGKKIHQGK